MVVDECLLSLPVHFSQGPLINQAALHKVSFVLNFSFHQAFVPGIGLY